jgi:hypothetical protein
MVTTLKTSDPIAQQYESIASAAYDRESARLNGHSMPEHERLEKIRQTYSLTKSESLIDLIEADIEDKYLVQHVLVDMQPMVIAGASKAMKTTIATALAIGIASGKDFLANDRFKIAERRRVHFCSAESGRATTKKTIIGLCDFLDVSFESIADWITFDWWVPKSSNREIMDYFIHCVHRSNAQISIIDPLYQTLDDQQASVIANGQQLAQLGRSLLSMSVTPIMVDHAKRSSDNVKGHEPLQLEDISGAGKAEFFRQWMLIGRREKFVPCDDGNQSHRVWLTIGGSAGHASQWALDIEESNPEPSKRNYKLELESFGNAAKAAREKAKDSAQSKSEEKERRQQERIERHAEILIRDVFKDDLFLSMGRNDIEARFTNLSGTEIGKVIGFCQSNQLLKSVPKSFQKNGRWFEGYMLFDAIPPNNDSAGNSPVIPQSKSSGETRKKAGSSKNDD